VAENAAVAVDAVTGAPVWRNPDMGPSRAVPPLAPDLQAPIAASADLLWTTFGSSEMGRLEVQALDLRTGSPRYRATFTPAVPLPLLLRGLARARCLERTNPAPVGKAIPRRNLPPDSGGAGARVCPHHGGTASATIAILERRTVWLPS
jgi:hypothetical protein